MKYGELTRGHDEVILNKLVAAANGDESVLMKIVQGRVEITLRVVSYLVSSTKQVVNYNRSIAESLVAGKYDWTDVSNILDVNFPSKERGECEVEFGLFHFNKTMSSDDVIAKMKTEGFRPATIKEMLAYEEKNPEVQREFPIITLCSVPLLDGNRYVGYFFSRHSGWPARLSYNAPFLRVCGGAWTDDSYRFLAVRN